MLPEENCLLCLHLGGKRVTRGVDADTAAHYLFYICDGKINMSYDAIWSHIMHIYGGGGVTGKLIIGSSFKPQLQNLAVERDKVNFLSVFL